MSKFLLVVVSGGLGSGLRYLLSAFISSRVVSAFPYGTLAVNVLGSFLIAAVMWKSLFSGPALAEEWRLILVTGFLGGFTTYSAFNNDVLAALSRGAIVPALANFLATTVLCLSAGALGLAVGRLAG